MKGLLLNTPVKKLKKRLIFGIVTGKKVNCLVHFLRHSAMWRPDGQSARDNHLLACNFAIYSPIK